MPGKVKLTQVRSIQEEVRRFKGDLVILGLFKDTHTIPTEFADLDRSLGGAIAGALKLGDFAGNANDTQILYVPGKAGVPRVLLCGLGEKEKFKTDILRQCVGTAVRLADRLGTVTVGLALAKNNLEAEWIGQAAAEGAIVGRYEFQDYLPEKKDNGKTVPRMDLVLMDPNSARAKKMHEGCRIGSILAEGQNLARMIGNQPANAINPSSLAREAQKIARQYGLKCNVFDERRLAAMKMDAILAVGNGSASKPRLIVLEYAGRKTDHPDAVVIGKAVTFDSGGIDLKPAPKMELMKFDKSGGCAVLGIMAAAAKLKLPLRVVGLIPSAENLLSSSCWRPGDIVRTYAGKTVEILSTDAEGRMLLADALGYAVKMNPKVMVDLATLTGACAIALGEHYAGLFGNNDPLITNLQKAAETSGEPVWPLPAGAEYLDQIKSKIADLKNVGTREGAACQAAAFLAEFTAGIPWAHIDIACVAKPDTDKSWRNGGVTGFGVRLVLEYLRRFRPEGMD